MKFLIRSLIILTMFTVEGYGEPATSQVPEKTWLEKIVETIFPEKVAEEEPTPNKNLTGKTAEKAPKNFSKKVADTTPKKATDKSPKKVASKAPEKATGPTPKKVADKTPEKKKLAVKPLPEISMGSKDAPVVMINYSSLSCGHCAHFNADILPQVEKKYIKTGQLRIIFRDYPGDQVSLRAHQLAWCKGEIKYLDFMKILYANQEKWLLADDPVVALKAIALQNGIPAQQFEACLKNQELLDQIIAVRLDGQKKYNITATPTIIINAKIYQEALGLDEIDKIMKPLLAKSGKKGKEG